MFSKLKQEFRSLSIHLEFTEQWFSTMSTRKNTLYFDLRFMNTFFKYERSWSFLTYTKNSGIQFQMILNAVNRVWRAQCLNGSKMKSIISFLYEVLQLFFPCFYPSHHRRKETDHSDEVVHYELILQIGVFVKRVNS